MMKASTTALLASAMALLIALPAQARRHDDGIYERLDRQQSAIERGIRSGELTRREAGILREEHREIRDLARDMGRDGYRSRELRRILDRKLDRAGRHIRELSANDAYDRGGRPDQRGGPSGRPGYRDWDDPRPHSRPDR